LTHKKSPLFLTDCKCIDFLLYSKHFLRNFTINVILIFLFSFLIVFLGMQLPYLHLLQRFYIVS